MRTNFQKLSIVIFEKYSRGTKLYTYFNPHFDSSRKCLLAEMHSLLLFPYELVLMLSLFPVVKTETFATPRGSNAEIKLHEDGSSQDNSKLYDFNQHQVASH